jgi:hypothetical protein
MIVYGICIEANLIRDSAGHVFVIDWDEVWTDALCFKALLATSYSHNSQYTMHPCTGCAI